MSKKPKIQKLSKAELRALRHRVLVELALRRRKIEAELMLLTAVGNGGRGPRKARALS